MFKSVLPVIQIGKRIGYKNVSPVLIQAVRQKSSNEAVTSVLGRHHGFYEEPEYDDAFMKKYVAFFSRPDIDHWEIRRAIHDLHHWDLVPDPSVIIACLKACRKLNDYALAIRYLESVKEKCCGYKKIWPYVIQEITPTLKELGIETPEQLGYDKPELALQDVMDIH